MSNGILPAGTIVGNNTALAGTEAPTRNPVLGLSGTAAGSLKFENATSGSITLQPAAGALGTTILTLPATTGTLLTSASPTTNIVVGTTTISSGTSNGILFNNGGLLGNTNSAANALLATNGSNVPSLVTTLPDALTIPNATLVLVGETSPIVAGSLFEVHKDSATVQLTVVDSKSAVSIVSSDFGLVMRGVNTAGQDSGAGRFVSSQLGASYDYPTSANGATIRALETHVVRSADVPFATTMGIELGVHAGIGSGWDGTGTVPVTASVGAAIGSSSAGWLTEPGVRNDVGIFVAGANGWRRAFQYSDESNNNIWYVDQSGAMLLSRVDDGATAGPVLTLDRKSASPGPGDLIGNFIFSGRNASAATVTYAQEEIAIISTTAGAHDGEWAVKTAVAGSVGYRLVLASGMQFFGASGPTGGDKGPGTINCAGSIYVNNVVVPTVSSSNTLTGKSFGDKVAFAAATTSFASLNIPVGGPPSAPADGDMWREDNTNTGLKIRINGVTKTITVT
jgi:hypothetical protein